MGKHAGEGRSLKCVNAGVFPDKHMMSIRYLLVSHSRRVFCWDSQFEGFPAN